MRFGILALTASTILFATAAASASGGKPAGADPMAVIKARQASMRMSGAIMGGIKGAIDRGDDVKGQAFAARSLSGWAAAIPGMFPEGTNMPPSGAMPSVWSNPTGFAAAAATYQAAADKMATAAQAGDKAAFAAAFQEVRGACSACHSDFKTS